MLASKPINGFAPTKDSKAARSLCEGVLGLKFLSENPYVLVMKANDTMIILQKVDHFVPASYTILGWEVDDIEAVVSFLTNKGVIFERLAWMEQDALGIWKSPEGKVLGSRIRTETSFQAPSIRSVHFFNLRCSDLP